MEKQKLFKNSIFGDKYVTRSGKKAIFLMRLPEEITPYLFIIEGYTQPMKFTKFGRAYSFKQSDDDIVGWWQDDKPRINKSEKL